MHQINHNIVQQQAAEVYGAPQMNQSNEFGQQQVESPVNGNWPISQPNYHPNILPVQYHLLEDRGLQQFQGGDAQAIGRMGVGGFKEPEESQVQTFMKIYREWCDRSLASDHEYLRLVLQKKTASGPQNISNNQADPPTDFDMCFFIPLEGKEDMSSERIGGNKFEGKGEVVPEASRRSVVYRYSGLCQHSVYFKKLIERRREDVADYIQQFNDEYDAPQQSLAQKRQQREAELRLFQQSNPLFRQPETDLCTYLQRFQQIKDQIIAEYQKDQNKTKSVVSRVLSADGAYLGAASRSGQMQDQSGAQPSLFLLSPSKVNSTLLIRVLNFVKHGQDLVQLLYNPKPLYHHHQSHFQNPNQQQPQQQLLHLNPSLISDILVFAHALKLDLLQDQVIQAHIIPNLTLENVLHFMKISILFLQVIEQNLREIQRFQQFQAQHDSGDLREQMIAEESEFEMKSQKVCSTLYKTCHSFVSQHLYEILDFQSSQFLELKHFQDPIHEKLLSDSKIYPNFDPFSPLDGGNIAPINNFWDGQDENQHYENICERLLIKCINDNWLNQVTFDFTPALNALCRLKGFTSLFELLRAEKEKTYKYYEMLQHQAFQNVQPSHEWTIKSIERLKIEEDNPFFHDNALWKMGVTYNKQNQSCLKITLNLVQDPFQNKKCQVYFKKKEFYTSNAAPANRNCKPSSGHAANNAFLAEQLIHQYNHMPVGESNGEVLFGIGRSEQSMTPEEVAQYKEMKAKVEAMQAMQYAPHTFVSIITATRLNDEPYRIPRISTLIVQSKSPTIVQNVKCFIKEDYIEREQETGQYFKIGIFVKVQRTISALLASISTNFHQYCSDPLLQTLELDDFKQILRHKRLAVHSEDEIVRALNGWLRNPFVSDEQIKDVLSDVNWNYTSLPYLLNLAQVNPKLRANAEFRAIFEKEISWRLLLGEGEAQQRVEEPRFSYRHWCKNLGFDCFAKDLRKDQRDILKKEQTKVKQMVLERNSNFQAELIHYLLNPVNPLHDSSYPLGSQHSSPHNIEYLIENLHLLTAPQMATLRRVLAEQGQEGVTWQFMEVFLKKESQFITLKNTLKALNMLPYDHQEPHISNRLPQQISPQILENSGSLLENVKEIENKKVVRNQEVAREVMKEKIPVKWKGIAKKFQMLSFDGDAVGKNTVRIPRKPRQFLLKQFRKSKNKQKSKKQTLEVSLKATQTCDSVTVSVSSQCNILNENELEVQKETIGVLNSELQESKTKIELLEEKVRQLEAEKQQLVELDEKMTMVFTQKQIQEEQLEENLPKEKTYQSLSKDHAETPKLSNLEHVLQTILDHSQPRPKPQSSQSLDQMCRTMQESNKQQILQKEHKEIQLEVERALLGQDQVVNSRQQRGPHQRNFTEDHQDKHCKLDFQQQKQPIINIGTNNQSSLPGGGTTTGFQNTCGINSTKTNELPAEIWQLQQSLSATSRVKDFSHIRNVWLSDHSKQLSRDIFDQKFLESLQNNQHFNYSDLEALHSNLIYNEELSKEMIRNKMAGQGNKGDSIVNFSTGYPKDATRILGDFNGSQTNDAVTEFLQGVHGGTVRSPGAEGAGRIGEKHTPAIHIQSPQSRQNEAKINVIGGTNQLAQEYHLRYQKQYEGTGPSSGAGTAAQTMQPNSGWQTPTQRTRFVQAKQGQSYVEVDFSGNNTANQASQNQQQLGVQGPLNTPLSSNSYRTQNFALQDQFVNQQAKFNIDPKLQNGANWSFNNYDAIFVHPEANSVASSKRSSQKQSLMQKQHNPIQAPLRQHSFQNQQQDGPRSSKEVIRVSDEDWKASQLSNYPEENISEKMKKLDLQTKNNFKTSILGHLKPAKDLGSMPPSIKTLQSVSGSASGNLTPNLCQNFDKNDRSESDEHILKSSMHLQSFHSVSFQNQSFSQAGVQKQSQLSQGSVSKQNFTGKI